MKSSAQMPARHQTNSRSPTLVGRVHRTTGQPSGAGVQPGLPAQPVEPVAGQHAPEPAGDEPPRPRQAEGDAERGGQDDRRPVHADLAGQPVKSGTQAAEGEQFGAPPPGGAYRAVVHLDDVLVEGVEVVALAACLSAGHGWFSVQEAGLAVVQSLMQATGQAVPQDWQMCAVSVRPPPVSTSSVLMSSRAAVGADRLVVDEAEAHGAPTGLGVCWAMSRARVFGVGGAYGDPRFGAAFVAGGALAGGPADGGLAAQHARLRAGRCGRGSSRGLRGRAGGW